jgi:ATP-binding cassette subfamily C (CFTR/MRP) protein 2
MILDFLTSTFMMLTPVLIYFISVYLVDKEKSVGIGFAYLAIVVAVRFFRSFFDAHCGYTFLLLGSDISNSLALGMINKALSFSVLCNKRFKMGELANLLQVDCARLLLFPKNFSSVIFFFYQIVFAIVFMSLIIGPSFLAGFAVTIAAGCLNVFFSRFAAKYQRNLSIDTDNRMKISNEIFNNVKFIKVNAWEEYFYDKLEAKRDEELGWVKKKFLVESAFTFSMWLAPKMILVATFATFVLTTGE